MATLAPKGTEYEVFADDTGVNVFSSISESRDERGERAIAGNARLREAYNKYDLTSVRAA